MRCVRGRPLMRTVLMGCLVACAMAFSPSLKAQPADEALPFAGVIEEVGEGAREIVIDGVRFQLGRLALARGEAGGSAPGPEALQPGTQVEFGGALPATPNGAGMIDALRIVPM